MHPTSRTVASTVINSTALRPDLRKNADRIGNLKGRQPQPSALDDVDRLVGAGALRRDGLIEYLHRLNDGCGALFERHLVALAQRLNLGLAEVVEVASFYHHFEVLADDAVAPRLTVRVCNSLSCAMAGGQALHDHLAAELGSPPGSGLRVVAVPCVGRCEQAPVAVVGQRPVPQATADRVLAVVRAPAGQPAWFHPPARDDGRFDPAPSAPAVADAQSARTAPQPAADDDISPAYVGYASYCAAGGYRLAAALVNGDQEPQAVLAAMANSGLRGLGGAGFPAGRKWRIVQGFEGPRVLAVNIDEGEPGTFKDRRYLARDPHRFLEGMLVAAQVVGTETVVIYLRDEYAGCRAILAHELARLQADPPCPLPRIELRRGAGAYICGEESAMLESIEGRRGEPRLRPPYIAERGLFGRPTLAHNFETLYWVRDIVQRGPDWFSAFGRRGRQGLRSFSVSGPRAAAGRQAGAGRHQPARAGCRALRRHGCGPHLVWLPAGRRVGRHLAGLAGR